MDRGDAVRAMRADDREIRHADLSLGAFFDEAHAFERPSSPGNRVRTSSRKRRLISWMISR